MRTPAPRVLILIDTVAVGGPGRNLFLLLDRLAARPDAHCVLCNFSYPNRPSNEFNDHAHALGHRLRLIRERFRFDPSIVTQALRILRQERCNVIETHGYKTDLLGLLLARMTGAAWLAVAHGWTSEDRKVLLYHSLDLQLLRFADIAVTVSRQLTDQLLAIRKGRVTETLFNAVEPAEALSADDRRRIREELGVPETGIVLGCFGRLSSEKGQTLLLMAFEKLARVNANVSLILAGDGPDRGMLEHQVKHLGLAGKVHLLGYQSKLMRYFAAIDLLVLPSLSEGLPNVVLEAMSCGRAALATDVGAIREVITDGENGWIVDGGQTVQLAEKMIELCAQPALLNAMGERARRSLFPKFSVSARAESMLELYNRAAALSRSNL